MYDSKMALAVKVNTRVLREFEDAVYIPFGSEYSLLIKNLNSVKAMVRVWIDGVDVTEGTSLVVNPNSSIDLERFIKNGNLEAGNKFKFIERTAAISNHRGNKIDDGLIRVEFEYAVPQAPFKPIIKAGNWPQHQDNVYRGLLGDTTFGDQTTYYSGVQGQMQDYTLVNSATGAVAKGGGSTGSPMRARGTSLSSPGVNITSVDASYQAPQSDVGITVAGDVSDQKFTTTSWFATDGVKHVMVMRVLGEVEGKEVAAPVTVKTKPTCSSCGKVNKATAKFCSECGTGLQIV